MYAAEVVERAPAELVARAPAHPYTLGLLRSFPDMRSARRELRGVPGNPPDLRQDFPGCPFEPRCEFRFGPCRPCTRRSAHRPAGPGRRAAADPQLSDWRVACHLHDPRHRPGGPPAGLNGRCPARRQVREPAGSGQPGRGGKQRR